MSAAHEAQIKHLGECMLEAHARYSATGCFDALGMADGYRIQMERAIAQRSASVVASMEAERGLS